jgi:hypothetical protein
VAELLKDRGWLYYYRKEWDNAEADLQKALACAPAEASRLQADILDAMSNLNRGRGDLQRALTYAERSLAMREQGGDLLAIAKSLGNLGFLYRAMRDDHHALLAHQEALATYQKLGNKELMAAAWLNIGAAHFHATDLNAAIDAYRQSLEIGQSMRLPLIELKAHYNLAEAYVATRRLDQAQRHWRLGYQLCEFHGFADQAADFIELAKENELAVELESSRAKSSADLLQAQIGLSPSEFDRDLEGAFAGLSADEATIMELVRREHKITARRLMEAADISRATATRRLTGLVEKGVLAAHGQGRGAYYILMAEVSQIGAKEDEAEPSSLVPRAEVRQETVNAILQRELPGLAAGYAIRRAGLIQSDASSDPTGESSKIVVGFSQTPDLITFFTLRQQLATLLHLEVDLLPDFTLSLLQQSSVDWIWQQ